jgi:hypothetical protein
MAIPTAVVSPFLVAAFVLWKTEHWSDGALGSVIAGLLSIACIVGTFMAPLDADGRLQGTSRRARRRPR